jgi:protein SCO1/2
MSFKTVHLPSLLWLIAFSLCLSLAFARAEAAATSAPPQHPGNWFISGPGPVDPTPPDAKNVTVKEHLNAKLPLDLSFVDEAGKPVQLKQYFDNAKRPVVLQLGYYKCPMLCTLVAQGFVNSVKDMPLNAGSDYEVVFVSIDPSETPELAAAKKQSYLQAYKRPGAAQGWHLLTGKKEQIEKLAQAVGFGYKWIEYAGQYSHPACIVLCTPDGHVSRYLYGVKFEPKTVRLSLVEASNGKIGSTVDQFILTCFQYDGHQGKYALAAIGIMRVGGALTVLILAGVLIVLFRREARRNREAGRESSTTN